jgi:hypothetical protein
MKIMKMSNQCVINNAILINEISIISMAIIIMYVNGLIMAII